MDIDISDIQLKYTENTEKSENKQVKLLGGINKMNYLKKVSDVASKYMALIVLVVAGVGVLRPSTFLFAAPYTNQLLGVIMFCMGVTLKLEDFKLVLTRPKDVLCGSLAQYTVMPFLAYAVSKLLNLPTEFAVGLILVGCCPGGQTSNVMAYIAKGDVALSVTLTSLSTVLAPFVTPALVLLLGGESVNVSMSAMCMSIVNVILVPILLGFLCNKFFAKVVEKSLDGLPLLSVVALSLIIGGIVGKNSELFMSSGLLLVVAVAMHNMTGYLVGYLVAKVIGMEEAKRRTMSIEVGLQSGALATSLATQYFSPMTVIPGVVASVYHAISGALLSNFWANKALDKNDENVAYEDVV